MTKLDYEPSVKQIKSFRLAQPKCPGCGATKARSDYRAIANLWRVPVATLTALLVHPLVGIRFMCPNCGRSFID